MELKRVMLIMLVVMIVSKSKCSYGCLDHERIALLKIKTIFYKWLEGQQSPDDCCEWDGVTCDDNNESVIELDLSYSRYDTFETNDSFEIARRREWYLNISLFLPFHKLQTLDLYGNEMAGLIEYEGFERLSHLENLDLSSNKINDSRILSYLCFLPSLKSLSMSSNNLEETLYHEGFKGASKSCNLEILDLSDNSFNKNIFHFLKSLPSLKILNLNDNELHGKIHLKDTLMNLEELDIGFNSIKKFATPKGDKSLSKLKILAMDSVDTDTIKLMQSMGSLSFLQKLRLGFNTFSETVTTRHLPNFKKMEVLDLFSSTLSSNFLQSIRYMNALKVLDLEFCELNGTQSALQGIGHLKHLQTLDLSENNLVGTLPAFLANLTSLQTLDLSNNQFTGDVGESPITSLMSLQELYLSTNNLKIPISFRPFYNHSKLVTFQAFDSFIYDDNHDPKYLFPKSQLNYIWLSGQGNVRAFPKFLCQQHDLKYVSISDVHFKEEFPNCLLDNNTSLYDLILVNNSLLRLPDLSNRSYTQLMTLDISHNLFNGEIPSDFGDAFINMEYLDMSSNRFHGQIPPSFCDMRSLDFLDLSNNKLFGKMFSADLSFTKLTELFLNGNNFSGRIPDSLSRSTALSSLNISRNNLEGPIPVEFCQLKKLEVLDLSENIISGSIPSCFSPPYIQILRLSNNKLQGNLNRTLTESPRIYLLDLSNNQLSGSIPKWIHMLYDLNYFLLNNNYLAGEIPVGLCQLDQLSLIDLSNNYLQGTIPGCLHTIPVEEQDFDVYSKPAQESYVQFPTKSMSYNYQGELLSMMSGIDLSCNKLFGEIPPQLGNLSSILVLNLSHNNLSGPIPSTFGNLMTVESLDLSNNYLNGKIPPELGQISSLEVFSVANNNLSGEIPRTTQFTTFNESSFQGNPLLCGTPLPKSCSDLTCGLPITLVDNEEEDDDGSFMDMECFYASFAAAYLTMFLGVVIVLWINPNWRRWWLYHIEEWMTSSYYLVVDNLPKKLFPWKLSP
ncbi:hypothetical protein ACFE04_010638 [Oxalis oulophora]